MLLRSVGSAAFRHESKQVNVALTDAIVVGLMRRLQAGDPKPSENSVRDVVAKLPSDPKFLTAITRATADEESVKDRLALSTKLFGAA